MLNKYKEFLENKGYKVLYMGLYGSQNYNLHNEESDIDVRAIVLLPLADLLRGKTISKTYELGEEGLIDVKDVMTYYKIAQKGNPSFIEPIQSSYALGEEEIANIMSDFQVNPMALAGMAKEKYWGIKRDLPRNSPTFEKFGYDTKQLLHIVRLVHLLETLEREQTLSLSYLSYNDDDSFRKTLLDIKEGKLATTKEEALELAEAHLDKAEILLKSTPKFEKDLNDEAIIEYLERQYKLMLK